MTAAARRSPLHRHGVPSGRASLLALVDTLSYAVATSTLVVGALVYLGTHAHLDTRADAHVLTGLITSDGIRRMS